MRALFSPEILQAGAVKGLKYVKIIQSTIHQQSDWQLLKKFLDFNIPSPAEGHLRPKTKTQKVSVGKKRRRQQQQTILKEPNKTACKFLP